MGTKRKITAKYEGEFLKFADKNNLRLSTDEDCTPIVVPSGKKRRELYKVCPHSSNSVEIVVLGKHAKTKTAFIKRLDKWEAIWVIKTEGESELILIMRFDDLLKVADKLKLIKYKKPRRPNAVLQPKNS
jgi:hypothetical protein